MLKKFFKLRYPGKFFWWLTNQVDKLEIFLKIKFRERRMRKLKAEKLIYLIDNRKRVFSYFIIDCVVLNIYDEPYSISSNYGNRWYDVVCQETLEQRRYSECEIAKFFITLKELQEQSK